jgi:hypothetical protein
MSPNDYVHDKETEKKTSKAQKWTVVPMIINRYCISNIVLPQYMY